MNVVLNWVKANLYTVIFVAIMIVAPITLAVVAGKMNAGVQETVKQRAARLNDLKRLEKTAVKFEVAGSAPVNADVLVNQQLLDRYRRLAEQIDRDAQATRKAALEFNRKDHQLLLPRLFPQPPMHEVETLPFEMYRVVVSAYDSMLDDVGAGSPPDAESVREDLDAARERFRTQVLIKSGEQQLTAEENAWLADQLSKTRLARYADAAKTITLYASPENIGVPYEAQTPARAEDMGLVHLFNWQWHYWVKQDILGALARANESADSVIDAPVKRLVSLAIVDAPVAATVSSAGGGGESQGGGFGMSGGGSGGGRRGAPAPRDAPAPRAPAANPSAEVRLDYGVSFTGRGTNALYDVIFVELVVIVETSRIPEVFDALCSENFFTITDVQYDSVDQFAEARSGYYYGGQPVSQLTIELETIWLREWTAAFMPPALKQMLGIPEAAKDKG